ncbi:MAG: hypothetical protein GY807_02855, partial [Gammaproteobacteria bacterium]|nr:hypothetical protein [Gammaproteobacteria bacterium]
NMTCRTGDEEYPQQQAKHAKDDVFHGLQSALLLLFISGIHSTQRHLNLYYDVTQDHDHTAMKITILSLLMILMTPLLHAKVLNGEGYGKCEAQAKGKCEAQAKERALGDLASVVQVEVKSSSTSVCAKKRGRKASSKCNFEQQIHTQADLPLLGVRYGDLPAPHGNKGKSASLDSRQVLRLYRTELDSLRRNINARNKALQKTKDKDSRYRLLHQQLAEVRQYRKHRLVAVMLSTEPVSEAPDTEARLTAQILELEKKADSMPYAARLLAKGLNQQAIYIFPPRHRDAVEITPFAAAFRSALAAHLKTVSRPSKARYIMKGEYDILKNDDIHISYQLLDKRSKVLKTRSTRLSHAGWKDLRAQPLAPDLDQLLHQGSAISNEFRASVSTDRGASDLLFCEGESTRLVAKMNQPGYFYIVGHVMQNGKEFSYLLDLGLSTEQDPKEVKGPQHFIRHVPPEQVNHSIVLGEFEVVPPFGVEHLQMIAANRDLKAHFPRYRWDEKMAYYVIKGSFGDAKRGVSYTRGLRPKIDKKKRSFEAVLSYTTIAGRRACQ